MVYIFSLIVNDQKIENNTSLAHQVIINATTPVDFADMTAPSFDDLNTRPIANAGVDQNININSLATLDGSNSSDEENSYLTYSWYIISKPTNSNANLDDNTLENPTFTTDLDGTYKFALVVDDGESQNSASVIDQVVINATTPVDFSIMTAPSL